MGQPVHELTDELMAVVVLAADHGIDSLRRGGPLVPFVLSETALGGRRLQRVAAGRPVDPVASLARARGVASACAREDAIVALVHGGWASVGGERRDAVVVECTELGGPTLLFVQAYRPRRRLRPLRTRGNLTFLGEGSAFAAAA
jgi:hypothetical protein